MCEGIYAVRHWEAPETSVTYRIYARYFRPIENPIGKEGPPFTWLLQREQIERLIPKLKAAGVALGNSPFHELRADKAAITEITEGCRTQKPNLRKTMTYLRSNLFKHFDPITMFFDTDADLDPEIRRLIDDYGVRLISHSTNQFGERITLPAIESDDKVLVAGSSQANGAMVDDSETIASQLQALDKTRQYVNIGIGDATTGDTFCALRRAAQRYPGQIRELIYVFSESNFRYGSAQEAIDWIKGFADSQKLSHVTIVYVTKIYNIVPQITRFRNDPGEHAEWFSRERSQLPEIVATAGFRFIDITDLALDEIKQAGTQFAALSLFVDHGHLSPYGTARLVERILQDSAPARSREVAHPE
jgi:lysophospholipase L1-like esterase